jgi:hypothetical protein
MKPGACPSGTAPKGVHLPANSVGGTIASTARSLALSPTHVVFRAARQLSVPPTAPGPAPVAQNGGQQMGPHPPTSNLMRCYKVQHCFQLPQQPPLASPSGAHALRQVHCSGQETTSSTLLVWPGHFAAAARGIAIVLDAGKPSLTTEDLYDALVIAAVFVVHTAVQGRQPVGHVPLLSHSCDGQCCILR